MEKLKYNKIDIKFCQNFNQKNSQVLSPILVKDINLINFVIIKVDTH